jgi:hypothetical protein
MTRRIASIASSARRELPPAGGARRRTLASAAAAPAARELASIRACRIRHSNERVVPMDGSTGDLFRRRFLKGDFGVRSGNAGGDLREPPRRTDDFRAGLCRKPAQQSAKLHLLPEICRNPLRIVSMDQKMPAHARAARGLERIIEISMKRHVARVRRPPVDVGRAKAGVQRPHSPRFGEEHDGRALLRQCTHVRFPRFPFLLHERPPASHWPSRLPPFS